MKMLTVLMVGWLVVGGLLLSVPYRLALTAAKAIECRCDTCCEMVIEPLLLDPKLQEDGR